MSARDASHMDGESVTAIAQEEGKGERQIRLRMSLAFVFPATVRVILEDTVRVGTITELAKRVPLAWETTQ